MIYPGNKNKSGIVLPEEDLTFDMRMKKADNKLNFRVMLIIILLCIWIFPVSGQTTASDSLKAERIKDIQRLVHQNRIKAQRWWYGWLAGYSAATIGQDIVCFTSSKKATKQDMALGSATTFLGAIGQLITPIVPKASSAENYKIPTGVSSNQLQNPDNYEEVLKEIARREKEGRSWKMHAITGVVNAGSGLVTWLGFRRTIWDGLENFALNTIITEVQIWTQPTRAVKDYKNYCKRYNSGTDMKALKPGSQWFVRASPGGIAFEFDF
jgi:hypothetical protein